jgi:hypothetical protein
MRRHVERAHSSVEIKWIDLVTGQTQSYNPQNLSAAKSADVSPTSRKTIEKAAAESAPTPANRRLSSSAKRKTRSRRKPVSITKKYLTSDPWAAGYRSEEEDDDDEDDEEEDENEDDAIDEPQYDYEAIVDDSSDAKVASSADEVPSSDLNRSLSSSTSSSSDVLRLHCHLCSFSVKDSSPSALFRHYRNEHETTCSVPEIHVTDLLTS